MNFKGKKEVVRAVQKLLGVSADGADGPVTWNAILAQLSTKDAPAINGSIAQKMVSLARLINYDLLDENTNLVYAEVSSEELKRKSGIF